MKIKSKIIAVKTDPSIVYMYICNYHLHRDVSIQTLGSKGLLSSTPRVILDKRQGKRASLEPTHNGKSTKKQR